MIYERVSALCKARGISVSGLEKELGFGGNTIGKWKTVSPSVNKLLQVAEFFGVTLDSLAREDG